MKHGFTIAEFLVVTGLIILLALISIPFFRSSQKTTELKSEARILVADLRLAQQNTIAEQKTYLIKLFSSPASYQLIKRDGGDMVIKDKVLALGISWQNQGSFANDEIVFLSNGAIRESGTIVLQNNLNQTLSVEIKPSGYVRTAE